MRLALGIVQRVGPYGLAAALQSAVAFFALPVLLLLIGAPAYGTFALLEPLVAVLAQVLLLGTHQALIHAICKQGVDARPALVQLVKSIQPVSIGLAMVAGIVTWALVDNLAAAVVFGLALYVESVNLLLVTAARAVSRSWLYFLAVAVKSLCLLALALAAMGWWGRGGGSAFTALLIVLLAGCASLASLALALRRALPEAGAGTRLLTLPDAARYGLPLVFAGLCYSSIALADRFVLARFASPEAVAAYVVSAKYAAALNLAVTPVNLWWPTARFQHLRDPDGGARFFQNASVAIAGVYGLLVMALIGSAGFLLPVLGPGAAADPAVAAVLLAAGFLTALQVVLNIGLLNEGQTSKLLTATAMTALIHVAGLALVVPRHGAIGAATMNLVSTTILTVSVHLMSQRVVRVHQRFAVLAVPLMGVAAVTAYFAIRST